MKKMKKKERKSDFLMEIEGEKSKKHTG